MLSRRAEPVRFAGGRGGDVAAWISAPPDGYVAAWALFAHGFADMAAGGAAENIAQALTQAGIGVLGVSAPAAASPLAVADVAAATEHMAQMLQPPAILIGHSLAGAALIQAAGRIDSARAIATIGVPVLFESATEPAPGEQPTDGFTTERMLAAIAALQRPLIVFHSPVDRSVGIENAGRLYRAARNPKSFVSLDDADHLLSGDRDSLFVGAVVAAWAARYIDPLPPPRTTAELADNRIAARTAAGAFRTEILAGGHALLADEPTAVGGEGRGPTPYDLLAAALGACTTMTVRMYADRKQWPLTDAVARLRHSKIHAVDEEHCEGRESRLDLLEREVELIGPLGDAQRARLMEIADRCPVHRTLTAGVRIETRMAQPEKPAGIS